MAVAPTAVDTATGQIENEDIHLDTNTSYIKGNRQEFRRRYAVYIDSSSNEGISTERLNFIGTTPAREFRDGSSSIPYQNLGIAMTAAQYNMFTAGCNMVKVHSLGYEIKKITVLQENLAPRAGSTVIENTFQSRPSVLLFPDTKHMWDEVVGISGLTAMGARTGRNTSQPRLMTATLGLPTLATAVNNDATTGTWSFTYGGSQTDGGLPEVSWYMVNGQTELSSQRMYLDDTINPVVLGEGKKHSFKWINPAPQWHKSGSYPYNGTIVTNGTAQANKAAGYWPSTRADALGTYYKGSLFDQTADNAYDSTQATVTAGRRAGLDTKGSHTWMGDHVPPYNYIKLPPLWGPEGKMNFTVELWIEFTADLEWHSAGILAFSNNLWPGNASVTNTSFSATTGMMDLRNTFGASQGQSALGLAEEEEEAQQNRRRNRFEERMEDGEPKAKKAKPQEVPNETDNNV